MPTKVVSSQLVPASFHQELVQAMEAAGFTLMYRFQATTDRDTYHVPVQYAQKTAHFFYVPSCGFIVQLELSEGIDEQGHYSLWWNAAVYLQLDEMEIVKYEVHHICPQHRGPRFFMDDCKPMGHVFGNLSRILEPFWKHGNSRVMDDEEGSYGWTLEHSGPLTVAQLVGFVDGLYTHFGPFLKAKLSHNFNAFYFAHEYAWPGIRPRFWRSFPTRLLKELVPGRILGRESAQTRAYSR
jgi:hypothetical protein